MDTTASVLVVARDSRMRRQIGDWLADEGFEVLECPGPRLAAGCLGLSGGTCPLADVADAVVLDASGMNRDLPGYYAGRGKRLVMVGVPDAGTVRDGAIDASGPLERGMLVAAVRMSTRAAS